MGVICRDCKFWGYHNNLPLSSNLTSLCIKQGYRTHYTESCPLFQQEGEQNGNT